MSEYDNMKTKHKLEKNLKPGMAKRAKKKKTNCIE